MKSYRVWLIILSLLLTITPLVAQTNDEYAIALDVRSEGVEIQRVDTQEWIALPRRAVTPIGVGDTVRILRDGRASMQFTDASSMLLLPGSQYLVEALAQDNDSQTVHLTFSGVTILNMSDIENFRLTGRTITVTDVNGVVGFWSDDLSEDAVTVTVGTATIEYDDETTTINELEGILYQAENTVVTPMNDNAVNRAYLVGDIEGCRAIVQTTAQFPGVNVRTGAGENFLIRGLIEDDDEAVLLAQTENSGWVRVQYTNSFGWVIAIGLQETGCDLPVVPDTSAEEDLVRIINPTLDELDVLVPFYGNPRFDSWFYRYR